MRSGSIQYVQRISCNILVFFFIVFIAIPKHVHAQQPPENTKNFNLGGGTTVKVNELISSDSLQTQQPIIINNNFFSLGAGTTIKVNELISSETGQAQQQASGAGQAQQQVIINNNYITLEGDAAAKVKELLSSQSPQEEEPFIVNNNFLILGESTTVNMNELVVLPESKAIQPHIAETTIPDEPKLFGNIITGEEATTEKMFGPRGSLFHPYLSIQEEWTDNVYNINFDQAESLQTVVSTGVWLSLPRLDAAPGQAAIHNSAVGGARMSPAGKGDFTRFQAYLHGGVNYYTYSEDAELDKIVWRIDGQYQQNLPAGITFSFSDRLSKDRDNIDLGSFLQEDFTIDDQSTLLSSSPSLIRDYYSNYADFGVTVDMTGRFTADLGYTNFFLDYDGADNSWLDRTDHSYSIELAYNYSPKTQFYVEYKNVTITYDTETINDGSSSFLSAGIDWQGSDKTTLRAQAGYQIKEYDTAGIGRAEAFTTQVLIDYRITEKTRVNFTMYKALEETNSFTSSGVDTIAANLHYEQQFNYKLLGRIDLRYEKNDYEGFTRNDNSTIIDNRKDFSLSIRPALEYTFREWLMCDLAYTFVNRNSTVNVYDYTTQSASFSMNIAF